MAMAENNSIVSNDLPANEQTQIESTIQVYGTLAEAPNGATIHDLYKYIEDFSPKAANLLGILYQHYLEADDNRRQALRNAHNWCKSAIPLLNIIDKTEDPATRKKIGDHLMKSMNLINDDSKITECQNNLSLVSGHLTKLLAQLKIDFKPDSSFYQKVVEKCTLENTTGVSAAGTLISGVAFAMADGAVATAAATCAGPFGLVFVASSASLIYRNNFSEVVSVQLKSVEEKLKELHETIITFKDNAWAVKQTLHQTENHTKDMHQAVDFLHLLLEIPQGDESMMKEHIKTLIESCEKFNQTYQNAYL